MLRLVHTLHVNPIVMLGLDLPHEADYKMLFTEPVREDKEPRSMVNLTNLTMPMSSPQIQTGDLNTNIRFVSPLNIQPIHPSSLFKSGALSAGWDYRIPKSNSTPAPIVTGKLMGDALSLPQIDLDDENDEIRLILEPTQKGKGKEKEKDSPPVKKQWNFETSVSHSSSSKHSKSSKYQEAQSWT